MPAPRQERMSAFLADLRRHLGKDQTLTFRKALRIMASEYGVQALACYRLGRWLIRSAQRPYLWPVLPLGWPVYWLLSRYVRYGFGISLHLTAEIGPGLYIGHFGGILVSRCRLGENCSIAQSTHIAPDAAGSGPILGDRVWVGALAQIIGPHQIGNRSTVSAAAVVQRDIPENALCMGNPARVVLRTYDNTEILGA